MSKLLFEFQIPTSPVFDRYSYIVGKAISSQLGQKLYRYGGRHGYQTFTKTQTGKGIGILYFVGLGMEAFRLNYETRRGFTLSAPKVTSVDYWKDWKPDAPATRSLIVPQDINLLSAIHQTVQFLKTPSKARISLIEAMQLDESYGKASLDEWRAKAIEMFGRTQLTMKELQQLRQETGWKIPNIIWMNEVPGIKPKRYQIPGEDSMSVVNGEKEISNDDEQLINRGVKAAEEVDVNQLFADLIDLTEMVGDGFVKALLVTGGAGTGKTFTITNTLEDMGLIEDADWHKIAGKTSAFSLYKSLFAARDNGMLVFDDCDSVFASEESRNILKAALDTNPRRVISWDSASTVNVRTMDQEARERLYANIDMQVADGEDKIKFPNKFEFTGRIIFISNLNANQIEEAIRSRSAWIDVTLSSNQVLDRIGVIMEKINVEGLVIPLEQKKELLEFLRQYANENPKLYVSMRNFVKGLNIIASGKPNWQKLVKYV